jgi:hypothetical protein
MKKFTNFKVKTWELVVICIILASVVLLPDWLVQLNQTLIGKGLLLVALVAASLHKPYMGLLVLLLIVSLGYYREGLVGGGPPSPSLPTLRPSLSSKHHPSISDNHLSTKHEKEAPACTTHTEHDACEQASCSWKAGKGSCGKKI